MESNPLAPGHDFSQGYYHLLALPGGDERDEGGTLGYDCAEVRELHAIADID
ncbi:hypothetical protein NEUTE1DRAFT_116244 [Neurospora tetrasperma FGSC 2508]|uniref:Uncharacterized protein n=1 Tax=Neurospora tetrasperma (strain FGSC 2508 / ATCC MYA-4615 / P0657) TaxID=510951 RepID=F8MH65_NEUT8|nr:uncharacterized protein NEUTE1DRAFT_116244 [Neurospora tetrasperma FGSC 2508]EGO58730.1 hypothetical protein NEUTE1DRAFT_116244 [Neurospora tetrasperma FGSC 2508]EGZ72820.1 hypothetical protein NEUTE2DRAFT_143938 [Neurospora tetrasperma FGSC 2509]